jgi:hypothetical protein
MEWTIPPAGWTTDEFAAHTGAMINSLDIVSADDYGWTDPYELNQKTGNGTGHYGSWVYGHAIDRLHTINPRIPAYGFIECCSSSGAAAANGNGAMTPTNVSMPGMLQSAVWNLLVHGARGIVWWTADFWDLSAGKDPQDSPYSGAGYYAYFALYADHQWDAQYRAAQQVNRQVASFAQELNSPTVSGISASSPTGVPVAVLGKSVYGRLWLLAQADGDQSHPLSNTSPIQATITLPSSVPPGTVLDVVGENRTVTVDANHQISDEFGTVTETPTYSGIPITYGYQHHVYSTR